MNQESIRVIMLIGRKINANSGLYFMVWCHVEPFCFGVAIVSWTIGLKIKKSIMSNPARHQTWHNVILRLQ